MVNLCNLLVKYSHFSKVDDDVFVYIDHILENAYEIHQKLQKARNDIENLNKILEEKQKCNAFITEGSPKTPAKKRKVRSLDVSFSPHKENVSILEDSNIFPCKSDPETSSVASFILEQNILDSEESFFALTQSPPRREVLSVKNAPRSDQSPLEVVQQSSITPAKPPGSLLRASRLRNSFGTSKHTSGIEQKSTLYSTPSATSGKWTGKKQSADKVTPKAEQKPTEVKRVLSLEDRACRFRQTKLKFPDEDNVSLRKETEPATDDDAMFSDFVVPTPPSVANKSNFFRSLRTKKQSTIKSSGSTERSVSKSVSAIVFPTREKLADVVAKPTDATDDDYDIDQTFCPGAESISRLVGGVSAKIKQEPQPLCKPKSLNTISYEGDNKMLDGNSVDSDSSGVVLLPPSPETIISVADSQPTKNDSFFSALNEARDHRKESLNFGLSAMAAKINCESKEESPSFRIVKPHRTTSERNAPGLCIDCSKLYQFHTSRGISDDTARSKLPRNCRNCRIALLHSTPPGFWNPDFLPTQK